MADIDHQETLDFWDRLSVSLYRAGISVFSLSLIGVSVVRARVL